MKKLNPCIIHEDKYLAFLLFKERLGKDNILLIPEILAIGIKNIKDYYYG